MERSVNELYGLKIGDRVKYIGNDENTYGNFLFDKEGIVKHITPLTGEFHVKIEDLIFNISFFRYDLLLLDQKNEEEIDFNGHLTETFSMTSGQMRGYLNKYHNFIEGRDYSITDREDIKEVTLTNQKFTVLVKELSAIVNTSKELTGKPIKDFKHSLLPNFSIDGSMFLSFKASDWVFTTPLTPWDIQHAILNEHGLNIYKEWGFTK